MRVVVQRFTALCLLCLIQANAFAEDQETENSYYMGFQFLGALENSNESGGALIYDDGMGIGWKFGLRMDAGSENFDVSIEANMNAYSSADLKHVFGIGGVPGQRFAALDFSLMLRPKLNFTSLAGGGVEPYVYGGAGVVEAKIKNVTPPSMADTSTAFAVEFGGGIEFAISDRTTMFTEIGYLTAVRDFDDFPYTTIATGFNLRF